MIWVTVASSMEPRFSHGIWGDSSNIIGVMAYSQTDMYYSGWIVWYRNNQSYHGELSYVYWIDAYCATLYNGDTIQPTVIQYRERIGEVCIDTIDGKLLIGYAITHPSWECSNQSTYNFVNRPTFLTRRSSPLMSSTCTSSKVFGEIE